MARRGELRSRVRTQGFMGGLAVGGGLLALAASSLVLIPFIIGVVMLIGAYLLIKLVPNSIANWLRRSLYGKEQETFRFQPFQSMQEEQESLKMVFSGIEFDMEAVRFGETLGGALVRTNFIEPGTAPRPLSEAENAILQNVNLTVTISFPKQMKGVLSVGLRHRSPEGDRKYLVGAQYNGVDVLPLDRLGAVISESSSVVGTRISASNKTESAFSLEQKEDSLTMSYEGEIDAPSGGFFMAIVRYMPEIGMAPEDSYVMEI